MLVGKVNAAMRLLDDKSCSGVLQLSDETMRVLQSKHPQAIPAFKEVLLNGEVPFVDPILFSAIDEFTISRAALYTKGVAAPSGLGDDGWRRILVSRNFCSAGTKLRFSLAMMARNLCTKDVNPDQPHQPSN